jgi:hypothetical protein
MQCVGEMETRDVERKADRHGHLGATVLGLRRALSDCPRERQPSRPTNARRPASNTAPISGSAKPSEDGAPNVRAQTESGDIQRTSFINATLMEPSNALQTSCSHTQGTFFERPSNAQKPDLRTPFERCASHPSPTHPRPRGRVLADGRSRARVRPSFPSEAKRTAIAKGTTRLSPSASPPARDVCRDDRGSARGQIEAGRACDSAVLGVRSRAGSDCAGVREGFL